MKYKVCLICESEDEAKWIVKSAERSKDYAKEGRQISGVLLGILRDRFAKVEKAWIEKEEV